MGVRPRGGGGGGGRARGRPCCYGMSIRGLFEEFLILDVLLYNSPQVRPTAFEQIQLVLILTGATF